MGSLQATEMRNRASEDPGLRWHLQGNHYPPIHLDFLPAIKKAIEIGRKAIATDDYGLLEQELDLPNGKRATVRSTIEQVHLEPWLEPKDEDL